MKITSANSIENTDSPLARRDVSAAEVCLSSKKNIVLLLSIIVFGAPISNQPTQIISIIVLGGFWICYFALSFTQHKENRSCKGIFHFYHCPQ
ncbi:MAG: hypothetical protein WB975_14050, partial [Nitrososphaeraceae archaeon]